MTNEPLKATHTPLPWRFEAGVEDNEGEFYVCHAGTVCTETTVCNPRSEADARLIVHAVNSHHDLIEALRAATDALERLYLKAVVGTDSERHAALEGAFTAMENGRAILTKEPPHG